MRWVIAYDVSDDGRRLRAADALLACGHRVQLSVFEVDAPASRVARLVDELHGIIDEGLDSVRVYRICNACIAERITLGAVDASLSDEGAWIV